MAAENIRTSILELMPQQYPFRFLDSTVELDADKIIGEYTFDPELPFSSESRRSRKAY